MSYSADIMATGEARSVREQNPEAKVAFGDPDVLSKNSKGKTKLYWSDIFENNPNILQPGENAKEVIIVSNFPKSRTYIDYAKTKYTQTNDHKETLLKIAFHADFEAQRGELFFSDAEIDKAKKLIGNIDSPIVIIDSHPNTPNKGWLQERWEATIERSPYKFVQLIYKDKITPLNGATQIHTEAFREACTILKICVGRGIYLGVEGDLHHAAAAVNLPAVVLWSHYSHPDNLGYKDHINIRWDAAGDPCGLRAPCAKCKVAMEMIRADDVVSAIELLMKPISKKT